MNDIHVDIIGNGGGGVNGVVDDVAGALNVAEIAQPRFGDVLESLVDTTNLAINTYRYPDVNGLSMLGFNNTFAITGKLIADATGVVTLTVEATNDEAITDWIPVTEILLKNDNTTSNANITITNGTVLYGLSMDHFPYDRVRIVVVTAVTAVNTVICKMLRKAQ